MAHREEGEDEGGCAQKTYPGNLDLYLSDSGGEDQSVPTVTWILSGPTLQPALYFSQASRSSCFLLHSLRRSNPAPFFFPTSLLFFFAT